MSARSEMKTGEFVQGSSRARRGHAAVWQARLIMLVMINIAQLWILAATVDAALARHYSVLPPLVIASGICFLITLSILRWWRPTSGKHTSTGYVRENSHRRTETLR
jgi:hypothetical protein